mmetsp:Transcript_19024/g.31131  ORF Transcript_19024/g.31131 Transcript_19024/m.31131 type:complete len:382 (+) Transcript_19024:46-1191(+)
MQSQETMGLCSSSSGGKSAGGASKAIDKLMKEDHQKDKQKIKLLLLGTGESGKSTLFKQMKVLYGQNFSLQERERWTVTVYGNIVSNIKTLLEHTILYRTIQDEALRGEVDRVLELEDGKDALVDEEVGTLVKAFWNDPDVQNTWRQRAEFQVQDSLKFYCEEIDRIMQDDYIPTEQDILRARVRTSGIVEENYTIDSVEFVLFDVGGQRNERKKWIHCFDNVTAVIFVAALNEYNQVLYEDRAMNRMDEAVILFDEICNSPFFKDTSMILFLNKKDLFREKLAMVPFRVDEGPDVRYTDFEGPFVNATDASSIVGSPEFEECYKATKMYILRLFLNRNKTKEVYHHITTATDTRNVQVVFNMCKDIILSNNLKGAGFVVR